MKHTHTTILAWCSAFLVLLPSTALALQSNSYQLYDDVNAESDASPYESNSYSLNEGGGTWVMQPLNSANYQIVTAPPVSSSSSSSSSSESSSSDGGGGDSGSGGGGRGSNSPGRGSSSAPTTPTDPTPPTEPEEPPVVPGEPSEPEVPTRPELPAQVVSPTPSAPTSPSTGGTSGGGARGSREDGSFYGEVVYEDDGEAVCLCPLVEPEEVHCAPTQRVPIPVPTVFENPLPSLLLLMAAYGLGYVSHTVRPGAVQPTKKKKKKKSTPKKRNA